MTNQPSEKLKQCPFCGGEAHIMQSHYGMKPNDLVFQVECKQCSVVAGSWRTKIEDTTKDWNARANPSDTVTLSRAEFERVKDVLKAHHKWHYENVDLSEEYGDSSLHEQTVEALAILEKHGEVK